MKLKLSIRNLLKQKLFFIHERAFTLIELMISVVVLAIVVTLGYPSYVDYIKRVEIADAVNDIMSIEQAIARYEIAEGELPATLAVIGMDTLLDPWDQPYRYLSFDTNPPRGHMRKDHSLVPVNTDYDLYSIGEDGVTASPFTSHLSQDDIVRANNGSYRGIVEDY